MSIGLLALLDDVAALAKVAAASLDDVAGQAASAGAKALGVVIDDTAVTPRYVMGFTAERELPIIGRIALGSVRNKLLLLLPAALGLSAFAPWAITPLLMAGGVYLCFEGAEKVLDLVWPHAAHQEDMAGDGLEDEKVRSAVQTDFILSAEIMVVTLGMEEGSPILEQALVLAIVGLGITGLVYGVVALIVKADDVGVILARRRSPLLRGTGRLLVLGMPGLLRALGVVGTAAMVWVGGGILLHGLEAYGLGQPVHALERAAGAAARAAPPIAALVDWAIAAAGAGVVGLVVGGTAAAAVAMVRRLLSAFA